MLFPLEGERSIAKSYFFTGDERSNIFSSFLGDAIEDSTFGNFCIGGMMGNDAVDAGIKGIFGIGEVRDCILDSD